MSALQYLQHGQNSSNSAYTCTTNRWDAFVLFTAKRSTIESELETLYLMDIYFSLLTLNC